MAEFTSPSSTPRKTYSLGNICVLCGFSFVQIEKRKDGTEVEHKYLDRKLKLTSERLKNIQKVTEMTFPRDEGSGVCQKCYRSVENVIKSETKATEMKLKIRKTAQTVANTLLLNLPSPRRMSITKRMLRSPDVSQPAKKHSLPLVNVSYIKPAYIAPFKDITSMTEAAVNNPATMATHGQKSVKRSLSKSFEPQLVLHGEIEVL